MIGKQIAHYDITEKLGEGGMGEVYRAHDTKLNRDVALKILPQVFALDSQRMARFEREAQVLASLNHSHIAQIHGLEETDGTKALVLELVEGETLQEQIARGPIPVDEAMKIALQICQGLEAAHEKGVIHRDLKPANIKITPEGEVKILDFGLAKALEGETPVSDLSHSPTITHAATEAGVILGTASYMSPEQARGKPVDKRTDIWAFGCVLYEMLTGKKAFAGENIIDVVSSVVRDNPNLAMLPSEVPSSVSWLLERCLEKESLYRWRDAGDALLELKEGKGRLEINQESSSQWFSVMSLMGVFIVGIVVGLTSSFVIREIGRDDALLDNSGPTVVRSEIVLPEEAPLDIGSDTRQKFSLSPDGSKLVWIARTANRSLLYVREMKTGTTRLIEGTDEARDVFFSPDGDSIGFLTANQVKSVSLRGEAPLGLCSANNPQNGHWTEDGWIYFGEKQDGFLSRVASVGGKSEVVANLAEGADYSRFYGMLPTGHWALFGTEKNNISLDYSTIWALNVETKQRIELIQGGFAARYLPPGYLVFSRLGSIHAVPFDLNEISVKQKAVPIASDINVESFFGAALFSVSDGGMMVYSEGGDRALSTLTRFDREGFETAVEIPESRYGIFRLSPNQKQLAIQVADVIDYVTVFDLEGLHQIRIPSEYPVGSPIWGKDESEIFLRVSKANGSSVGRHRLGTREIEEILTSDTLEVGISSFDPTSGRLAFTRRGGGTWDIGFFDPESNPSEIWVESPDHDEWGARFSPDGNWFVYQSNESGQNEIWIRRYPPKDEPYLISTGGGYETKWASNGEVFYRNLNRWMAVRVTTGPTLKWEPPEQIWEVENFVDTPGISYDVSADGRYLFVLQSRNERDSKRLHLIQNWFEELRSLVPTE